MAKGTILSDTFEQLAELGVSSAKKTVKSMSQIVNPFDKSSESKNTRDSNNHTPVDFDKLKNKFQDKDKILADALRNRLFQSVKREDEKIIERKDMEEAQKKRQEEYEDQEKKRKDQQYKNQSQQSGMPTGKAKRGVMSKKKTSEQQNAENKPASGKQ